MPSLTGGNAKPDAFQLFEMYFSGAELNARLKQVIDGVHPSGKDKGFEAVFWADPANNQLSTDWKTHYEDDWLGTAWVGNLDGAGLEKALRKALYDAAVGARAADPPKPLKLEWAYSDVVTTFCATVVERPDAVVIVVSTPNPK